MFEAYMARGDIYGALGHLEKSKESFAAALTIQPGNPYAKAGLEQIEKLLLNRAGR